MNIFSTEHPLANTPRRTRAIIIAVFAALFVAVTLFLIHINSPRVIARAVAPDGTEFCVVQTCNWDLEFFTTSCYYRKPGGQWGWFYYDHEDWYWGRGRAQINEPLKLISIFRNGHLVATFAWELEKFQLLRPDFPQREFIGAQHYMPPEWTIAH